MDRLRVLMTADTVGGVWTYACELIGALAPLEVDVTLATMGGPVSAAQARRIAALPNAELVESRYALEWMPEPWRDVDAAGEWLLELARARRVDLVHVNGYAHAALPFGVPVIAVAHSCVLSWFRAVRGHEAGPEWNEYRARTVRGLRTARSIVAPTAAILRAILDAHGVERRGRVIANGCTTTTWRPAAKEDFVLSAGRLWDDAKGLADLDAIAARCRWPIYVGGPSRIDLFRSAAEQGSKSPHGEGPPCGGPTTAPAGLAGVAARGVQLLGELAPEALAGWMGRASIYALPARYEPFGLSILEAALSGCALVLGDLATLREVWGDTAVYVPPGDLDGLAFALEALARDPLRRGGLAACARARALAMSSRPMAVAYRALYDEELAFATRSQEMSA